MQLIKYARNSDGTYGPTQKGNFYVSKSDHRKTAVHKKGKTKWQIEEGQEFHVFSVAEAPFWYCPINKCLFGFIYTGTELKVLGINGELIAKFPDDRNQNEPWHGYPVSTEASQNRPSSELLDVIENENKISFDFRIKIERGRI